MSESPIPRMKTSGFDCINNIPLGTVKQDRSEDTDEVMAIERLAPKVAKNRYTRQVRLSHKEDKL